MLRVVLVPNRHIARRHCSKPSSFAKVVRASCAKAIGAVALKNPDDVESFPQYCIDAMVKVGDASITRVPNMLYIGRALYCSHA